MSAANHTVYSTTTGSGEQVTVLVPHGIDSIDLGTELAELLGSFTSRDVERVNLEPARIDALRLEHALSDGDGESDERDLVPVPDRIDRINDLRGEAHEAECAGDAGLAAHLRSRAAAIEEQVSP